MKTAEPPFLALAGKPDLDQETAYAICRLFGYVGSELLEDWDWDWLEKKRADYRKLIHGLPLERAWALLRNRDWLSLQRTNSRQKRLSTIAPLEGLVNLRTLVLQDNAIRDLQPLSRLTRLKELNCCANRISDLTPLENFRMLEEVRLSDNPVTSLRVLEELPLLRDLAISMDQVGEFSECEHLPHLLSLSIRGEGTISDLKAWPEMPQLKLLRVHGVKNLSGIERFRSLETVDLYYAKLSDLCPLSTLKALTHISISTPRAKALNVERLSELWALRRLCINRAVAKELPSLARLPVLHEIHVNNESDSNRRELEALQKELTPWDPEFKEERARLTPSLRLEVVDEQTFEYYDSKAAYGVREGECNGGMFNSERAWLVQQMTDVLTMDYEEESEIALPSNGGLRRSERLIIYSVEAYESFRDIVLKVQRILCEMKNDWIVWCQSLLWEAPEEQDIPEGMEDFIVWIYPDKIVATQNNARVVRKLIRWRGSEE